VGFALPNLNYTRDGAPTGANHLTPLTDAIKRALLRQADYFIVETGTVRNLLSEKLDIPHERITIVPNGLNPLLAAYAPTPAPKIGPFVILVPAAYYPHKNLEIVPEVAKALSSMTPGMPFEFRLTLNPASKQWQFIADKAARLDVDDHVRTVGILDMDALSLAYRAANAVFLPTMREASTAVYPESFHFERPIVTSDMEFARELCGDAAVFCNPRNAWALANGLKKIMCDPDYGAQLVKAGTRRLIDAYPVSEERFKRQMAVLERATCKERMG
jgi:glycosyltransferase involved in cell wall biosynthesis